MGYKQKVPIRKDEFYQQVFDAYFKSHDLTKDGGYVRRKQSGLNMSDFKKVLRYLGVKCLKHQFQTEFSKAELIGLLEEISDLWSQTPNVRDFYMEYRSGMSMTIGGRKFASYKIS